MVAVAVGLDVDVLQQMHQRRALVPRHGGGLLHHVVAAQRRDRHEVQLVHRELGGEGRVVGADGIEHRLGIVHRIELVHGGDQVADAQQTGDEGVAAGLRQHAVAGVDEDHGDVAGGRAGGHVARVLLVARGVGDDELALGGGEVAVRDVDGDALLAFGLQAVHQQRQVHAAALGAGGLAVAANGVQLVFVDHLGIVQQAPDERALAVVHAAAGEEAQDFLALVARQIGVDVERFVRRRGQRRFGFAGHRLAAHQK